MSARKTTTPLPLFNIRLLAITYFSLAVAQLSAHVRFYNQSVDYRGLRIRKAPTSMARVYADVNSQMPRAYWDYDSVNISWGLLENYEVVRKIGARHVSSCRGWD